jgi:fructose-1,6-bisphosphatase/inositol monophosphatase family enzyme
LLDELAQVASEVAAGAAQILERYAAGPLAEVGTKSSPTDMVSEADRASEAYISATLQQLRPQDSLLGEEGARRDGTSGVTWVADPLDGTTNFLYGVPSWAVSLAAEVDGRSVVGVVIDPSRDETWAATLGRGATLNGRPCHVAEDRAELSTALVATGFGYQRERRQVQAAVLPRLLPVVRDIRRFGSAALDLCWVAAGRLDAYFESNLSEWDWAAGRLVCQEAGGVVTVLAGDTVLATTPRLLGPLSSLLTGS